MHSPDVSIDSVLEGASQQGAGIEFGVFVGVAFQPKHIVERGFDMVETETQSLVDPRRHQRFGRTKRRATDAENLQRHPEGKRDILFVQLQDFGKLRIFTTDIQRLRLNACGQNRYAAAVE